MRASVHTLWFLVTCSDAIAAVLIALYFRRLDKSFGRYMALMMAGLAIEAVIAGASLLLFWQSEIVAAPAFAISRTIGRGIKAVGTWLLLAYLFYWIKPDDVTRTP